MGPGLVSGQVSGLASVLCQRSCSLGPGLVSGQVSGLASGLSSAKTLLGR